MNRSGFHERILYLYIMTSSEQLRALLKHKGIGPEGSKSLNAEQLQGLTSLLNDDTISLTTRATMLTAMVMLEPTEAEEDWIMERQPFDDYLPKDLIRLFTEPLSELSELNEAIIQHEDLSAEEAEKGAQLLFDPEILDAEKAIFLEGERLKRETFEENLSFFKVFSEQITTVEVAHSEVVLFGDSFDGCRRINPYTVFSCAVLASLGVKSYLTGVESVAPKNGVTARQLLEANGMAIPQTLTEATDQLDNQGWTYVDLSIFFPALDGLKQLRDEMVKRPFLATFEKMLAPIKGQKTHLVTAYTHKAYSRQVVQLNSALGAFDSMINVKGMFDTVHCWI